MVSNLQGVVSTSGRLNLANTVDTDGNGLPDWWEKEFFNQWTGVNPDGDPDNDLMPTGAEWLAGTNPTNSSSLLEFSSIAVTANSSITLQWPSVAGKHYRLLGQTPGMAGFSQLLQTNIAANPPLNTEVRTNAGAGSLLYRLQVEP